MKKEWDVVVMNQKDPNHLWKCKKNAFSLDPFWGQAGAQACIFLTNSTSDSVENSWDEVGQNV